MAKESSVAPKERVNIIYKPATGNAQEQVELPLKILMMGDYTGRVDNTPVEERAPINIDKDNFNEVMAKQDLAVQVSVANKLAEEGGELPVSLKFANLNDFSPERIVMQVAELRALIDLRNALNALKGPLGNVPAFRRKIQSLLQNEGQRSKLMSELGVSSDAAPEAPPQEKK